MSSTKTLANMVFYDLLIDGLGR